MSDIDKDKIRASLFNFVIYTEGERRVNYFQDLVKTVCQKFPCRIIFIKRSESGKDFFKISETAITANEGEDLCLQTTIEVGGAKIDDVYYLIFPYLIPDLPNYLLWGHDPSKESKILPYLERYASRLILDSEGADNLAEFAHVILEKMDSMKCDVTDLNWARFGGWRNIFSQTFDSERKIKSIKSATHIGITYNNRSGDTYTHEESQAVYLQAWLATQLHWKFKEVTRDNNITKFAYNHGKQNIIFELTPVKEEKFKPGSIIKIEIGTKDEDYYSFIRRPESQQIVQIEASTPEACDVPFNIPLSNPQIGISFTLETLYGFTSSHYKTMLQTLSKEHACTISKKKREHNELENNH